MLKYFQKFIAEKFIVLFRITNVCKYLSKCFFVVFCYKVFVKVAVFLFGIKQINFFAAEISVFFVMNHGFERAAERIKKAREEQIKKERSVLEEELKAKDAIRKLVNEKFLLSIEDNHKRELETLEIQIS